MKIFKKTFTFNTKAAQEIIDLSGAVDEVLSESGVQDGLVVVFAPGSTAGITTIEYESGVLGDLRRAISKLAPEGEHYDHDSRWGDGNGFSHVRAALVGPSLSMPVSAGRVMAGTWQQPVLMDFDNKPRNRKVIITAMGE